MRKNHLLTAALFTTLLTLTSRGAYAAGETASDAAKQPAQPAAQSAAEIKFKKSEKPVELNLPPIKDMPLLEVYRNEKAYKSGSLAHLEEICADRQNFDGYKPPTGSVSHTAAVHGGGHSGPAHHAAPHHAKPGHHHHDTAHNTGHKPDHELNGATASVPASLAADTKTPPATVAPAAPAPAPKPPSLKSVLKENTPRIAAAGVGAMMGFFLLGGPMGALIGAVVFLGMYMLSDL